MVNPSGAKRPASEVTPHHITTDAPTLKAVSAPPPGPTVNECDAEERTKRYAEAQQHLLVQELLKRFEADIVAREPGDKRAWEERMRRG